MNISQITKAIMSLAAEAELGALFINVKEAVCIRITLAEIGTPPAPTPIQTDNATANGAASNIIQPKQMKAVDMRFRWLRGRMNQVQCRFHWRPGPNTLSRLLDKISPCSASQNN